MLPAFTFAPPWKEGPRKIIRGYNYQTHVKMDYYAFDFEMPAGTAVYPTASGKVVFAGPATGSWEPLGTIVLMDHNNGYQSLYAHLATTAVTTGQASITRTTKIGTSGSTGSGSGGVPHLHFAIYTGAAMAAGNQGPICTLGSGDAAINCAVKPEPMYACLKGLNGGYCENLSNSNVLYRAFFKYSQAVSNIVGEACSTSSTVASNWRWVVNGLPPNSNVRPVRLTHNKGGVWQNVLDHGCYYPYYWQLDRYRDWSSSTSYRWTIHVAQYPLGAPSRSDAYRLQIINGSGQVATVDWD